ncbi:glycosyltransferase family 4 protein [Brachybacterium hainanense]|uniref:Glycosyltransferase family 4 protein n=1 Tax=Brachybacterium hainanense TaxID=1541174 RepID=A0ABV6RCJ7_9MICO
MARSLRLRRAIRDSGCVRVMIVLAGTPDLMAVPRGVKLVQVTDSSFAAYSRNYLGRLSGLSSTQATLIERAASRRTDHYAVASGWSKRVLVEDARIPPGKIEIVPFGPAISPETSPERSPSRGAEPVRFLFVASDWVRKGGDLAVEALSRIRARGHAIGLTVVGATDRDLPPWVDHRARLSQSELSNAYSSHDVLIEPTSASAGGVVVTDALHHGLPVLAHRIGGMTTLVQDGITGWLVEPSGMPETLVASIEDRVLRDDLAAMSVAARDWAGAHATWHGWAKRIASAVDSLR